MRVHFTLGAAVRGLAGVLAAASAAGCRAASEPTAGTPAVGSYRLVQLGARPLPAPLMVNGVQAAGGRVAVDSLVVLSGTLELGRATYAGESQVQWVRDGVPEPAHVSAAAGMVRPRAGGLVELVASDGCSVVYAVLDGGRELRTRPGGVPCGNLQFREDVFRRAE